MSSWRTNPTPGMGAQVTLQAYKTGTHDGVLCEGIRAHIAIGTRPSFPHLPSRRWVMRYKTGRVYTSTSSTVTVDIIPYSSIKVHDPRVIRRSKIGVLTNYRPWSLKSLRKLVIDVSGKVCTSGFQVPHVAKIFCASEKKNEN